MLKESCWVFDHSGVTHGTCTVLAHPFWPLTVLNFQFCPRALQHFGYLNLGC